MCMLHRFLSAVVVAVMLSSGLSVHGATGSATLDIDVDKPSVAIPPTFFGLMTEEINHAYDGGLYAELIQNRTFQDDDASPAHWSVVGNGKMQLYRDQPVNAALPVSLRLDLSGTLAGIANEGFWGIPVRPNTTYTASFYAKASGGFTGALTASLVTDNSGAAVATANTQPITSDWKKYTLILITGADAPTTAKAHFVISANGNGSVSFSLVSLFPPTYQNAPNGLRPDLMKLLSDMHPAFIRLPGGNYLEGNTFPTRFDWKKMIGPVDQRPGHMGCWGYRSSDGFGLPEYLLWCRQLNAEPVLAVFAGYVLNHDHLVAGPALQPYVDEALEEIEYVSGPADSSWGKRRAADGFPEPFALHYVEVGNEDWFDGSGSYDGRFAQFFDAIRARYPALKIIATMPVKSRKPDLVDDHYYRSARLMAFDSGHYDKASRKGPQVFAGEWATQEGQPTPDLNAGLADAAWLMGLERDADLIPLECYAPLFVNVNPGAAQWPTNLIGYDALHSFGSPSYYAQCMLAQNKGDVVLPATLKVAPDERLARVVPHGAIGVGTWHTQVEYKDISVTDPQGKLLFSADLTGDTKGWTFTGDKWNLADKVIKPAVADSECWAIAGDPAWTDYTLQLKARKTGGNEGFLILYHAIDGENYRWWNVGGWGNSRTQCEASVSSTDREQLGQASGFTVQTGKWYDLKLEVSGYHVRCFADGKLVSDVTEHPELAPAPIFASASYLNASHEVIVKIVNLGTDPLDTSIHLRGASGISASGNAVVLSGDPKDINTVDEPMKISPKQEAFSDAASSFRRVFPAHSLTLLRVKATP